MKEFDEYLVEFLLEYLHVGQPENEDLSQIEGLRCEPPDYLDFRVGCRE